MAAASPTFDLDATKLKQFHAMHFTGQPVPDISNVHLQANLAHQVATENADMYDDGLGYYEDGVKRTLTDDQIKMFRNSEIQRLLAARRREAESRDEDITEAGDRRKEQDDKVHPRVRDVEEPSTNRSKVDSVAVKSKRKAHFDKPEDDTSDIVLDY
jgi:hypothetical protein